MCVRQPAWLTEAWTRSQTPWPGPRPTGRTLAQAAGGGLGGRPASRQPRRRAPQLRHRPLCSSKNIPPQMEARPEVLAPSWRAILDGTDAPGFSHLLALLSPKCSRARFPAKLGVLTHTNPPRAPGQCCSSQNPYQGAFLVERTENNKRQRNEPERDRKRVAGR